MPVSKPALSIIMLCKYGLSKYLHESRQLTQAKISFVVLSWVVKISKDGQRNTQKAHHQI